MTTRVGINGFGRVGRAFARLTLGRDDAARHLKAGARKVLISAPGKGADLTVVIGVNDAGYDPQRHDIVPTSTGAARTAGTVLPELAGKLDGVAVRVPVEDGSLTDLAAVVSREVTAEEVNAAFAAAAAGELAAISRPGCSGTASSVRRRPPPPNGPSYVRLRRRPAATPGSASRAPSRMGLATSPDGDVVPGAYRARSAGAERPVTTGQPALPHRADLVNGGVMRSIDDLAVSGQRVLVRADLNVPMDGLRIADDGKIRAALPTVKALLARGAGVIVCSHLGRPGGRPDPALSLAPVADRLGRLLQRLVKLAADPAGPAAAAVAGALRPGAVAMLENLRFSPGETSDDDAERAAFAGQLAALAGQYVGDAFGMVYRRHASVAELPARLPHAAGYLMQAEIAALQRLTQRAERPYVVVLGGAQSAGMLPVLERLLGPADEILIGGAMAATFLAALGFPVGRSRRDGDLAVARAVLDRAGPGLVLPPDVVVAASPEQPQTARVVASGALPDGQMLLDIGPRAAQLYAARIAAARTVFWNGPMGVAEVPRFAAGTRAVASAMARNRGLTVIGGGETSAAVRASGYPASLFSHVSAGGGASLGFLAGRELPGLVALEQGTAVAARVW